MAWLRAKVYERLLDGFAAGLTDDVLVPLLIADLSAQTDDEDAIGAGPAVGVGPDGDGSDGGRPRRRTVSRGHGSRRRAPARRPGAGRVGPAPPGPGSPPDDSRRRQQRRVEPPG
ncbi:MAG TPA: hypothetical protein VNP37_10560 [Actinomycetospora sp.]|nr:hypothetical protein [Actinomycetospora sp.]